MIKRMFVYVFEHDCPMCVYACMNIFCTCCLIPNRNLFVLQLNKYAFGKQLFSAVSRFNYAYVGSFFLFYTFDLPCNPFPTIAMLLFFRFELFAFVYVHRTHFSSSWIISFWTFYKHCIGHSVALWHGTNAIRFYTMSF